MFEQDLEEDEECTCAVPYLTMPTLLHLQAMRNKLSVAYLSREMMEWSSLNTGTELKKLSVELQKVYKNFAKDTSRAYLLLARCRYFNQEFYRSILEGVNSASVTVSTAKKCVARVNMLTYKPVVLKTNQKVPFISSGGQTIQEAKKAWSDLLISHIKMVELRTNFIAIETAYRSATRRQNIIDQIVVPKTQATINYIITNLKEIDREESHRMRMMGKIKQCREAKRVCPCTENTARVKQVGDVIKDKIVKSLHEPLPPSPSLIEEQPVISNELQYQPVIIPKDIPEIAEKQSSIKLKYQQVIRSLKNFYELVSLGSGIEKEIPKKRLSLGDCDPKLDTRMTDKTSLAISNFLEVCKDARDQLDNLTNEETPCQVNSKLIDNLKSHIDAVILTKSKLHNSTVLAPSVKIFIQSCGRIDKGLKTATKDIDHTPLDESGRKRLNILIKNIDDVVHIITEYRNDGLLTPSLEEFSKICNEAKAKIGGKVYNPYPEVQKIDFLKKIVSDVESLTAAITRVGRESSSIQKILSSCKGFKMKLEEHKKNVPNLPRRIIEGQKEEMLSESIQNFLTSCENYIKTAKYSKTFSLDLSNDKIISKISELMVKWQRQGILSKSTIEFMTTAKNRWTFNSKNYDTNSNGRFILSPKDESLALSEENSNKYSIIQDKTVPKILNNNFILPPSRGHAYSCQSGSCEKNNHINNIPPAQAKLPKQSILSRKKVEESVAEDIVARTKTLQSDNIEGFEEITQYPSKFIEAEVYAKSRCCKFSEDTSVSLFSESDDGPTLGQSEMIVAEISAYDSCPVFESNLSDVWVLETCSYDRLPATKTESIIDPTRDSSEQSIEQEICFVYDTENSEERTVKKTYTM